MRKMDYVILLFVGVLFLAMGVSGACLMISNSSHDIDKSLAWRTMVGLAFGGVFIGCSIRDLLDFRCAKPRKDKTTKEP